MRKLAAFCLLFATSLCVDAAQSGNAVYTGGTLADVNEGTMGHLYTTSPTLLIFEYSGKKLTIPYARIDSFQYSQPVARHLGVLPAIAVALIKKRQRRHIFSISFHDESNLSQVAIFEVPKQMSKTLLAILRIRVLWPCQATWASRCSP